MARRGDERTAFVLAIVTALSLTPIVWLHYFALLVVVVAVAAPRLGPVWFVPLAMIVTPGSGQPSPQETLATLVIAALTVALALWTSLHEKAEAKDRPDLSRATVGASVMSCRGDRREALCEAIPPESAMSALEHVTPAASGSSIDLDVRRMFAAASGAERFAYAATFLICVAGSLFLTLGMGLQHNPDATLLHLSAFPCSHLRSGRFSEPCLVLEGLAIVQALVIGAAGYARWLHSGFRCGRLLLPFRSSIWIAPLGVDVIAGALFAWGWWRGRERWYWVAAGFHLSALLLVVAVSRARWLTALALAVGVTASDHHPIRGRAQDRCGARRAPQALVGGLVVATLALLPGLVAGVRVWEGTLLAFGVALTLGTAYAVRFDLSDGYVLWTSVPQTLRYAFPVVFVCFIEAARVAQRTNREGILVARRAGS